MAILGSVGAAVYRHQVADAVPGGLPPGALGAARDTLGGATAVAGRLPEQAGAALLHGAGEAFTQGMHAAAIPSGVVMTTAAVLATVLLRGVRGDAPSAHRRAAEDTVAREAGVAG